MASKNIVSPWSFKDGRDYTISLFLTDNSATFAIKVSDKITAEEWSGSFDSKYIENLTQRTGSYKPIDVFISMLKCAILKKSESVALDLMNFEDLELLRTHKSKYPFTKKSSTLSFETASATSFERRDPDYSNNKRYIIVTYIAEFDKVHYPIPLNYSGPPDPQVMQNNIKILRSEVKVLRNAKFALEEEVVALRQFQSNVTDMSIPTTKVTKDASVSCDVLVEKIYDNSSKQLNLKARLLEQQLSDQHEIMESQKNLIDKLNMENETLREKLQTAEKYEEELENEIYELKKSNPRKTRIDRHLREDNGEKIPGPERFRRERSSREREKSNLSDLPWGKTSMKGSNFGRIKTPSPSPVRSKRDPTPLRFRNRSRSFSPMAKFDPTAYVQDKKIKQQRLAELRLANIQSKFRGSSSSSREGSRSRSNSHVRSENTNASRYSETVRKSSRSSNRLERCGYSGTRHIHVASSKDNILKDIERAGRIDLRRTVGNHRNNRYEDYQLPNK